MNRTSLVVAGAVALALGLADSRADAYESAHGPFYVQGSPLGIGVIFYPGSDIVIGNTTLSVGGSLAYYRVDAEFGYHISGRADGLALGLRQTFYLGWGSAGTTTARVGYDFAIPIGHDDDMELMIAPFAHLGAAYPFNGGDASFTFGFGVEGKLYFDRKLGLYAFVRPAEVGFFINSGPAVPVFVSAAGVGWSF